MVWSVIFGLVIGVISAVYRNKWPDRIGMTLAVSGISFPAFALGILLMEIFSVELRLAANGRRLVLEALHSPVDHARRSGCRRDGPLHACFLRGSAP